MRQSRASAIGGGNTGLCTMFCGFGQGDMNKRGPRASTNLDLSGGGRPSQMSGNFGAGRPTSVKYQDPLQECIIF